MLPSGQQHSYLLASVGGRGTRVVRTAGEELQDITGRWGVLGGLAWPGDEVARRQVQLLLRRGAPLDLSGPRAAAALSRPAQIGPPSAPLPPLPPRQP
jgi:hypothetical protein